VVARWKEECLVQSKEAQSSHRSWKETESPRSREEIRAKLGCRAERSPRGARACDAVSGGGQARRRRRRLRRRFRVCVVGSRELDSGVRGGSGRRRRRRVQRARDKKVTRRGEWKRWGRTSRRKWVGSEVRVLIVVRRRYGPGQGC
jgi:hypothetical protein